MPGSTADESPAPNPPAPKRDRPWWDPTTLRGAITAAVIGGGLVTATTTLITLVAR